MNEGGHIEAIYTDFEKAFDKVPHKRLLSKLRSYGVRPEVIRWIESFLVHRQQRTGVRGHFSGWTKVLSGIPQGSVLGPLLFIIYINDLPDMLGGEIYLFADDAKIFKHIKSEHDVHDLQQTCDALQHWSDRWLLKLNVSKCMMIPISAGAGGSGSTYRLVKEGKVENLQTVNKVKDLGITVDSRLGFKDHIHDKVNKAYSMLGVIRRNFKHVDKDTFVVLYKSMVRSQLEYANSVWSPHHVGLIETLEKVQKRATKMVYACKGMAYSDRLRYLKLPTLVYRRHRGDMIEVYKILHGLYDPEAGLVLERNEQGKTRGHSL